MQKNIFKDQRSFLSAIALLSLMVLSFTACEDKQNDAPILPVENTTNVFTNKDIYIQTEKQKREQAETLEKKNLPLEDKTPHTYTLKDKQNNYNVTLLNKKLTFQTIQKPIILLNFFQSNCTPCMAQVESFKKLEQKYTKELVIINLFENTDNTAFMHALYAALDITSEPSSPLSIIYKNQNYYSHFEGLTPIEMIRYDIKQAIKK